MDMLELSRIIAALVDYPLGWLLALPRDLTVLAVALGTSLLLTLVRKWTTNQDLMHRCRSDLAQLGQLRREAKQAKDKPALQRMQTTAGMIKWMQMKSEFLGLVVSIVPIALLATWAYERLGYLPPQVGQTITFKAYYPLASVDRLTHIVAGPGIEAATSPVQTVQIADDKTNGVAVWSLRLTRPGETDLAIRHRGQTVHHPLLVGAHAYDPPVVLHGGKVLGTEAVLAQPQFLGLVPGIKSIGFDPWLVAYLVLAIIFVPVLRRLFGVA